MLLVNKLSIMQFFQTPDQQYKIPSLIGQCRINFIHYSKTDPPDDLSNYNYIHFSNSVSFCTFISLFKLDLYCNLAITRLPVGYI